MLLSQTLQIGKKLDEAGVFDPILEKDSNFFINIQRLKQTDIPEFVNSYKTIQSFFRGIIKLLDKAQLQSRSDTFYDAAIKMFHFPEVNGIRLGHSKSGRGAGFGPIIEEQVIYTAFDIVKAGIEDPEFFEMIPLFQKNVGPDRLSDMIAGLILNDIRSYTKRVYQDFNITKAKYPKLSFDNDGLLQFNNNPVYLVPVQIIHKLPVAERWSDISVVMSENSSIRTEMNAFVTAEWGKYSSEERKNAIKKEIFLDPESFANILKDYRCEKLDPINVHSDFTYFLEKLLQSITLAPGDWAAKLKRTDSFSVAQDYLHRFKWWIEYNGGWEVIKSLPDGNKEKMIQRIIHGLALIYKEASNLDLSCEPNEGYGPCDFKFSRGLDCTVVELKLSSNSQYKHGFQVQLPLYAKAENTQNMIYVIVDVGNTRRVDTIVALHDRMVDEGQDTPDLIVIDAKSKQSASKTW